jgi:phenylpropionate dioxygenase-like ring-hydroxylating dioxygenase large terminal subunit
MDLDRYLHVKANWKLIVDNLLDLTHLAFVHETTIGNAAWVAWNARSLADEPIVRLILEGTVVRVRLDRKQGAKGRLTAITNRLTRPLLNRACARASAQNLPSAPIWGERRRRWHKLIGCSYLIGLHVRRDQRRVFRRKIRRIIRLVRHSLASDLR